MCGPSNALQQFKQQTNVDRTLQQDRLTSRHHPAQGFRSHNPNAGLLDPEFEAFQAGLDAPPTLDHAPPFQRPAGFGAPSQAPSWAADFQRLQISPQPMQHHPQFHAGPSTSDWAQGFREHIAQTTPRQQTSSPTPLAFQQQARGFGNFGFQNSFQQPSYAPAIQSKGKEPVMADQFDDAAFERAFDQAREDMMADVEETKEEQSVEEMVENIEAAAEQSATDMLRESQQDLDDLVEEPTHRMHTSDIEYEPQQILKEEQAQQQQQYEDDALAATAQELLEKVEHNQSDKFKNSQFLGLMRKLRDREVRVEGDKMVETVSPTSNPQHHPSTHSSVTCKVPDCDISDHEFDHWESPYT